MRKFRFHFYHISFLDSLLKGLQEGGSPINHVVSNCQIKRFDLDNPDTYLPIEVCYEFMLKAKYHHGIDHVSSFYKRFQVGDLSDYGEFLTHCPDLLSILQNGIKYDHQIQTNGKLDLEINGAISRFSMIHKDPPSEARTISLKINMAMMLEAFYFVLGRDWAPLALEVCTPDAQWAADLLPSDDVDIQTHSSHMAVIFRTEELATKNPSHSEKVSLAVKDMSSASFVLNQVFSSMQNGYIPDLEDISGYFNCSRRTVLRWINEEGMSFHDLSQKHLFNRSLKLLKDQQRSVDEIGKLLGYANTPNFIRAFKIWTNVTPDRSRKQAIM